MRSAISLLALGLLATTVWAKLPPPSDEAKAAAALTAAKTAWAAKVDGYKLCLAMNRSADHYRKNAKAEGHSVNPAVETPPCADPGPFVPPAPPAPASAAK